MKKGSMKKQESFKKGKRVPSRQASGTDDGELEPSMLEMVTSQQRPAEGGKSVDKVGSAEDNYFAAMMGTHDAVKSIEGVGFVGLEPQPDLVMTDLQNSFASHSVLEEGQRSQFYANKSNVDIESNIASKAPVSKEYTIPQVKLQKAKVKSGVKTKSPTKSKVKDKNRSKITAKPTIERRNTETKRSSPARSNSRQSSKSSRSDSVSSNRTLSTSSIASVKSTASAAEFPRGKQRLSTASPLPKSAGKTWAQGEQTRATSGHASKKSTTLKFSRQAKKQ